jgi:hypothetical protein
MRIQRIFNEKLNNKSDWKSLEPILKKTQVVVGVSRVCFIDTVPFMP